MVRNVLRGPAALAGPAAFFACVGDDPTPPAASADVKEPTKPDANADASSLPFDAGKQSVSTWTPFTTQDPSAVLCGASACSISCQSDCDDEKRLCSKDDDCSPDRYRDPTSFTMGSTPVVLGTCAPRP